MGKKGLKKLLTTLLVAVVLFSCLYVTIPEVVVAQEEKGPPLNEIIWTVETDQEVGIKKVVAGDIDVFLWSSPWKFYEGLTEEEMEKIVVIKAATGVWCIEPNWAGAIGLNETPYPAIVNVSGGEGEPYREDGIYFNPFAIREIRYALNWLINREELIETALHGSGAPMFSAVQPSHPANASVYSIYKDLGLTAEGDPDKSREMLDAALVEINNTWKDMGAPYRVRRDADGWLQFYDGTEWKDVVLNFFMRTEDERHEEGLYVANLIETKWKIKVAEQEYDRTICIPTVYSTDPLAYRWDLYTAGWVSMSEEKYPDDSLIWYNWLAPLIGYPLCVVNSTIYELGLKLYLGTYVNETDFWDTCKKLTAMGIQEGYRIFTAECWEYFAINKERVHDIAFGVLSGLWPMWPFRTATTPDGVLRVAEFSSAGSLFMSAWNPVLGFMCVYSEAMWRYIRDYGAYAHPKTGDIIPVRVKWTDVEKDYTINETTGEFVGKVDVPSDAIVYNPATNKWETVGSGKKACVKIVYDYSFSNWHHGIPMDMSDVLASLAFYWEWAFSDTVGDLFYHPDIEYYYSDLFPLYKGIRIVDNDTIEVYGDYINVIDDNETASFYVNWPVIPWEVRTVMEYVVVNSGPITGKTYDWSEEYEVYGKDEWVDMINPLHVSDYLAVAELLNETGANASDPIYYWFKPNYTRYGDYTPTDAECKARWEALIEWIEEYEHICISNGPYILKKWDPVKRYLEMEAFRDETYPFTKDYWKEVLPSEQLANPAAAPPPPEAKPIPWTWIGVGVGAVVVIVAVLVVVLRKKA